MIQFPIEKAKYCNCWVKPGSIHGHWLGFDSFDIPYLAIVDDMGAICFVGFHGAAIYFQG